MRAGLRAADAALFVIAANEWVDEATRQLWRECADVGMPWAVVITKLDHARADHERVVARARRVRGHGDAGAGPGADGGTVTVGGPPARPGQPPTRVATR